MMVNMATTDARLLDSKARGRRIRERRLALGLTQTEVATQVGMTQPTFSSLERGKTDEPMASTLLGIAAALRTSPYLLMYDHAPPAAMEHTIAAMVDIWDRLTDRQRLQVVAYAQGLVDANPNDPPRLPPPHPKAPPRGSH